MGTLKKLKIAMKPDKEIRQARKSLKKMQKTNGELNTSLQKLTAQNTQAAKDLNEAKDRQRQLEKQLEEAMSKNKGCASGCMGMVAALVGLVGLASWLICIIV